MAPPRPIFTSLTRISDLATVPFEIEKLPRDQWNNGDYVVGNVKSLATYGSRIELANGRMIEVAHGDNLVGAFGVRAATLEAVGSWEEIGENGAMHALTGAGLFGVATSVSPHIEKLLDLEYRGHVIRNGQKMVMTDFVDTIAEAKCIENFR